MYQSLRFKAPRSIFSRARFAWFAIAISAFLALGMCIMIGCNSNKPKVTDEKPVEVTLPEGSAVDKVEVDNRTEVKNESVQISNSVWPWVFVVVVNNIMWLAFLYFSKKYLGFGRK